MLKREPNADDPLNTEQAQVYKKNPDVYRKNAREWTIKYALP